MDSLDLNVPLPFLRAIDLSKRLSGPIMGAIIDGNRDALRSLLEENNVGRDFIFTLVGYKHSLLYVAVQYDTQAIIKYLLLEFQANPNQQNDIGEVPLHFAARFTKLDTLRLLLANKANPNMQNDKGFTALHIIALNIGLSDYDCIDNTSKEMITALIQASAARNLRDNRGRTAEEIAPAITQIIEAALASSYNQATRPGR